MEQRASVLVFFLVATMSALWGCAAELTEIVVVVESDLAVPAQLDAVVVRVEGAAAREAVDEHQVPAPVEGQRTGPRLGHRLHLERLSSASLASGLGLCQALQLNEIVGGLQARSREIEPS